MDELQRLRNELKETINSIGGKVLLKHIDEQMKDGWDKFIDLPTDKKTSKAAFAASGKYKALKELKDWIDSEVKMAD